MDNSNLLKLNREICFLTGSIYQGEFKSVSQSMEGFGMYKFPNGSVYRGYFQAGKFHGSGRMKASPPYNFVLYGDFEYGRLIKLDYMVFHDGLRVYGDIKNNAMDFSDWKYCYRNDRRFGREHTKGLKGFGATPETALAKESILKTGFYDNEEGIFNEQTGFISERPPPFKPFQFISSVKDALWIKRHCRAGRCNGERIEPAEKVCRSILENNIQNQRWADANFGEQCTAGQKNGYIYFSNFYENDLKQAERIINGEQQFDAESFIDDDSKSSSSFSFSTPKNSALIGRICEKPKSPCQCEGSLSIDMACVRMKNSVYG